MSKSKASRKKTIESHGFRNKLLLNQWLISLFGINPLDSRFENDSKIRPFHVLARPLKESSEGLNYDNIHHFYYGLVNSSFFNSPDCQLTKEQVLQYEENIVSHTQALNAKRQRPIIWKYYQWLTLLFVEIYLDRFFSHREQLLNDLNQYVNRFNQHWQNYIDIPAYEDDDLNKLCFQNATGSGKTLLMHTNLRQYRHYATKYRQDKDLSRVILITPNEQLSQQHLQEFYDSNIPATNFAQQGHNLFTQALGLERVDVLEMTKLKDQEGPNTIATRSLGDQNLLLVDEGHRGMSGKEEGVWFTRRSDLCAQGFTFEYSATFEQAVQASGNITFENSYAKTVIFDYSYRWFYEDGFGKDYQILNLPQSFTEVQELYLTACLLKFYQQLRIYTEQSSQFQPFNIEKPLWVFVGNTVAAIKNQSEKQTASDVALIILFLARFLNDRINSIRRIEEILQGRGQDTGLVDANGQDIFVGAFNYLAQRLNHGETVAGLYQNILSSVFQSAGGGSLFLERVKGDSGEIALRVGTAEKPFGLVNVGDAKALCEHIQEVAQHHDIALTVADSDFYEAQFNSVKDSSSPVNLLIGSKKFVEGWDCWRVSTMGLMHVGKSEGSQIIQLFGRGIRLKGHNWSLKRSGHTPGITPPAQIIELETLNVFGIEADFMQKFRDFLADEGLPGNEQRTVVTIPLNVTYGFSKKLKIIRPKSKKSDGQEYDFKKDAPIPTLALIPQYLTQNPVISDWYPRIQALQSRGEVTVAQKDNAKLQSQHLALLDYDKLYFELEQFKRERSWYNINISKTGIKQLLENPVWYTLYLPQSRLEPTSFDGISLLEQVATELLKRYLDRYYHYCKRDYIEPRLELRELKSSDDNIPKEEVYQLIVTGNEEQVLQNIQAIKQDLAAHKQELLQVGDLEACIFSHHLFQPLFHLRQSGKITILPVSLGESEYQFVTDLKQWCDDHQETLMENGIELFLLRNLSRGKGVGFFEAGNFHPDFILWALVGKQQYVTFLEPHGLINEGPGSPKILFYQQIKQIETRLNDPTVVLNSFILAWTEFKHLQWGKTQAELEAMHILFMKDQAPEYIAKLMGFILDAIEQQHQAM